MHRKRRCWQIPQQPRPRSHPCRTLGAGRPLRKHKRRQTAASAGRCANDDTDKRTNATGLRQRRYSSQILSRQGLGVINFMIRFGIIFRFGQNFRDGEHTDQRMTRGRYRPSASSDQQEQALVPLDRIHADRGHEQTKAGSAIRPCKCCHSTCRAITDSPNTASAKIFRRAKERRSLRSASQKQQRKRTDQTADRRGVQGLQGLKRLPFDGHRMLSNSCRIGGCTGRRPSLQAFAAPQMASVFAFSTISSRNSRIA